MLGQRTGKSIGELMGGVLRKEINVYRASGNRGNTPEAEIEYLKKLVAETGAKAIKFRVGGRMSKNQDSLPGRTERLIPLVRETFGPEMTLYADSNSSYDVPKAIEVGRLMEEYGYGFFEEPCRFDHLEETKEVADALRIPVAGGEQEYSEDRFRWTIQNRARWTSCSRTCTTTAATSARCGSRGWRMRRGCSARRICRAQDSGTSTSPISRRAFPTPRPSTSSRETRISPSRARPLRSRSCRGWSAFLLDLDSE